MVLSSGTNRRRPSLGCLGPWLPRGWRRCCGGKWNTSGTHQQFFFPSLPHSHFVKLRATSSVLSGREEKVESQRERQRTAASCYLTLGRHDNFDSSLGQHEGWRRRWAEIPRSRRVFCLFRSHLDFHCSAEFHFILDHYCVAASVS